MTHSRVVLWVAALWVTALALSGCLFTGHEDTIKTPPLRLRSAVPADSVESVADSEGFFTASLSFNRSVGADELRWSVLPAPVDVGRSFFSPSARTWTLPDLSFEDGIEAARLLIDGPLMRSPKVLTWYIGPRATLRPRAGGFLKTEHGTEGDGAVIFALSVGDPGGGAIAVEAFFGMRAESVTVAMSHPSFEDPVWSIGDLVDERFYSLVGVIDSNSDGLYDPDLDWWGETGIIATADPFGNQNNFRIEILPPR